MRPRTKTLGAERILTEGVGEVQLTEAQLQALCVDLLRRMGWFAIVVARTDRRTNNVKGIPDIYAHRRGRVMWVEVKVGKNKLTPEQVEFQRQCLSHNIEWHEVRTIEEMMEGAK